MRECTIIIKENELTAEDFIRLKVHNLQPILFLTRIKECQQAKRKKKGKFK